MISQNDKSAVRGSTEPHSSLTYEQVYQKYAKLRKELAQYKSKLSATLVQLEDLKKEQLHLGKSYESQKAADEKEKLRQYVDSYTLEKEKAVNVCEDRLSKLEDTYHESMKELEDIDITSKYTDEDEILKEVRETMDILNEKLIELLGERFCKELDKQLNSIKIHLDRNSLERIVPYCNEQTEYLQHLNTSGGKFATIENLIKRFDAVESIVDSGNKQLITIILLIICILSYFAFKYVFPVYIVLLSIYSFYNIQISYRIYASVITRKSVLDNLNELEEMFKEEALAELDEEKQELLDEYEINKEKLEQDLVDAKNDLETSLVVANDRFSYNDKELQKRFENLKIVTSNKILQCDKNKTELEKRINRTLEDLAKTKDLFNGLVSTVKNKYLSYDKIGTDAVLEPTFLMDFDKKTKKPKFYEMKAGTNLILYDDENDVIDLIKLLNVQIRGKLAPAYSQVVLYDDRHMGIDFIYFKDDNNDNVFKIVSDPGLFKNMMFGVGELIKHRSPMIRRDYGTLENYNIQMLKDNSLPESYRFIFLLNPSVQDLITKEISQILLNCGPLGINIFCFVNSKDFYDAGDISRALVESVNSIYALSVDIRNNANNEGSSVGLSPRAEMYVLEKMIKPNNN